MAWPPWWDWELEISSHCLKRMSERGFNETDVRVMLDDCLQLVEQTYGTFLVVTVLANRSWEVVVSPDDVHRLIVVVTAYPC